MFTHIHSQDPGLHFLMDIMLENWADPAPTVAPAPLPIAPATAPTATPEPTGPDAPATHAAPADMAPSLEAPAPHSLPSASDLPLPESLVQEAPASLEEASRLDEVLDEVYPAPAEVRELQQDGDDWAELSAYLQDVVVSPEAMPSEFFSEEEAEEALPEATLPHTHETVARTLENAFQAVADASGEAATVLTSEAEPAPHEDPQPVSCGPVVADRPPKTIRSPQPQRSKPLHRCNQSEQVTLTGELSC